MRTRCAHGARPTLTDGIKMMLVHRIDEEQGRMLAAALGFNYTDLAGNDYRDKAATLVDVLGATGSHARRCST